MTRDVPQYIWCPGCECCVREADDLPCPNCQRCPFCVRKLEVNTVHCNCNFHHDPNEVESLIRCFGIPQSQVPSERQRAEIRKGLRVKKSIIAGILGGLIVSIGPFYWAIVGERTSTRWAGLAGITTLVLLAALGMIPRVFRGIEDRKLNREFPLS